MKQAHEADIHVGLLECSTDKQFEKLGRLVYSVLTLEENKRELVKTNQGTIITRECVVHGN